MTATRGVGLVRFHRGRGLRHSVLHLRAELLGALLLMEKSTHLAKQGLSAWDRIVLRLEALHRNMQGLQLADDVIGPMLSSWRIRVGWSERMPSALRARLISHGGKLLDLGRERAGVVDAHEIRLRAQPVDHLVVGGTDADNALRAWLGGMAARHQR